MKIESQSVETRKFNEFLIESISSHCVPVLFEERYEFANFVIFRCLTVISIV